MGDFGWEKVGIGLEGMEFGILKKCINYKRVVISILGGFFFLI